MLCEYSNSIEFKKHSSEKWYVEELKIEHAILLL